VLDAAFCGIVLHRSRADWGIQIWMLQSVGLCCIGHELIGKFNCWMLQSVGFCCIARDLAASRENVPRRAASFRGPVRGKGTGISGFKLGVRTGM
jgi:hypothetical protein